MKNYILGLICFILLLHSGLVMAQVEGSVCETANRSLLEDATGLSFDSACQIYTDTCQPNGFCEPQLLADAFPCEAEDRVCLLEARLDALTLLAYDGSPFYATPDNLARQQLFLALREVHAQEYAEALANYQSVATSNPNFTTTLMPALLYELQGDTELALAAYQTMLDQYSDVASSYLWRGELLVEVGQADLAAFDFLMLQQLTVDTMLSDLAASRAADYPLPNAEAQTWLLYPVRYHSGGVVGSFVADLAHREPRSVEIFAYPQWGLMLVSGMSDWLQGEESALKYLPFATTGDEGAYDYQANVQGVFDYGATYAIRFELHESTGTVYEQAYGFEFSSSQESLLALSSAPDPRFSPEIARCNGTGAAIQLAAGDSVRSPYIEELFTFYSAPNAENPRQISASTITLLSDARCEGEIAWYEVEIDGQQGWLPETDADRVYMMLPVDS